MTKQPSVVAFGKSVLCRPWQHEKNNNNNKNNKRGWVGGLTECNLQACVHSNVFAFIIVKTFFAVVLISKIQWKKYSTYVA
jgi:hypothetical protein